MNLELATRPFAHDSVSMLFYASTSCALGEVLVARSSRGVCAVLIGNTSDELKADLAARFPSSIVVANAPAIRDDLARLVRFLENPGEGLALNLDVEGSSFQEPVSAALRSLAVGNTVGFEELARSIGPLASERAMGGGRAGDPFAATDSCELMSAEAMV